MLIEEFAMAPRKAEPSSPSRYVRHPAHAAAVATHRFGKPRPLPASRER